MSRRRSLLLAVFAVALPLAACTPPSGPGGTTTTTTPAGWPAAGCLDGVGDESAPDLYFSGTPDERGNAVISARFSGGDVIISTDGSCGGQPVAATTIVRADDEATATDLCTDLGAGTDAATTYDGSPWTLPADAWACSETYFL